MLLKVIPTTRIDISSLKFYPASRDLSYMSSFRLVLRGDMRDLYIALLKLLSTETQ